MTRHRPTMCQHWGQSKMQGAPKGIGGADLALGPIAQRPSVPAPRPRIRGARCASASTAPGGMFVKLGQMLSTRLAISREGI